ncbi:MAG: HDIG domain-containing metalloprotein, partial [Candidatus Gracilibacteria bacterium]
DPLPEEPASLELKWATLLHDIGKYDTFACEGDRIRYDRHAEVGAEIAKKILKRLAFSKKSIDKVTWLIEHHMMVVPLFEMPDDRKRHWFLHPWFADLLEVYRADALGIKPLDLSAYEGLKQLYRHEITKLKLMPKQLVTGEEVMEILNLKPGKQIGEIILDIRQKQLAHEINTKQEAKAYVKKTYLKL